jgi:hypothetical protein
MRTPAIDTALERALSQPRLGRYMRDSGQLLDAALSLYERNQRMAEAFHRPLQALEVCLRNHLNERLVGHFGSNWVHTMSPPFKQYEIDRVDKAKRDLRRERVPITQGAVVAELTFGFWVTLLSGPYEPLLWTPLFSAAFQNGGAPKGRKGIHGRMNALRIFRNRVAHYEAIYHLNPTQVHADLIAAIGWICGDSSAWALHHSRVPYVLANPWPA